MSLGPDCDWKPCGHVICPPKIGFWLRLRFFLAGKNLAKRGFNLDLLPMVDIPLFQKQDQICETTDLEIH